MINIKKKKGQKSVLQREILSSEMFRNIRQMFNNISN